MIKRREFIKQSTLATAGTLWLPNFLKSLESETIYIPDSDKILIVIQLSGGNDGLNTIVPYQNELYYKYRPQIAIQKNKVLQASDELGFHPAMSKLNQLYDKGYLTILNNVGYPNPVRSHFRSMDIWQTASGSDEYLNSGWVGRFLDSTCKADEMAHKAIEIDEILSLTLKGEKFNGLALKNPKAFQQRMNNKNIKSFSDLNFHTDDPTLNYLYKTLADASSSADYIYHKSKVYQSKISYPNNAFAEKLKTIAELINSRVETKVYYVSYTGFDTHVDQQSKHERLLKTYSESVFSFIEDLQGNGRFKDVLVMTFSEFGRRVAQNASGGTDHGTANNLFIMGKNLKKAGFINSAVDLSRLDDGDLIHKVDFRSVYSTLLEKWLGTASSEVLSGKFKTMDFI